MEICIAVADWARGLTTWVLGEPGGEGTGARRRKRPRHDRPTHDRPTHDRHRVYRVSPSRATGPPASGRGAEMVVGWG
ncbi:hypothetical protein D0Z67_16630 [Streptomyces seoulensis]|uniref:Uncharacterized protein n=1 Tax=Streptomyces seoulensis TaxID=73044 RepID=A0A4P6TXT8_STRSO|nr:hypothetical protein D0Z67_16630 [Streptomyces seoulensis]